MRKLNDKNEEEKMPSLVGLLRFVGYVLSGSQQLPIFGSSDLGWGAWGGLRSEEQGTRLTPLPKGH